MVTENKEKIFAIDFIGIGAPRCGTTWLASCLADHPEICFSNVKETNFFDVDYNFESGLKSYKKHFQHCTIEKVKGEFTPAYFLSEKAIIRIKKEFPDIKIIMILRNPIDRTVSDMEYHVRRRGVNLNIDKIISDFDRRLVVASEYYPYLKRLLDHFSSEKIYFMLYENIIEEPDKEIKEVYDFLGVNNNFRPNALNSKVNSSRNITLRFPLLNKFIELRKKIKRTYFGRQVLMVLKIIGINEIVKKLLALNLKRHETPSKINLSLNQIKKLEDIYFKDIVRLEKMTGLPLQEKWKKSSATKYT